MSNQNKDRLTSDSPNILDSKHNFGISSFFERAHTINTLCLVAGICQILLGVSVITISILGFIQELWLSKALIMLSNVSTIIGSYLVYITISKKRDPKALLRRAMKRVMESKN